jgi:predicted acyltransferase
MSTSNQSELIIKIIKRSLILFLIGVLLNIGLETTFSNFRIPGVLQRISIVFLISALLFLKTSLRTQIIVTVSILVSYWLIMTFIPVPGIGVATLEKDTNLSAWLDHQVLKAHVWRYTRTWDPEGILSTLPAIASCLIGVLTGTWLKSDCSREEKNNGLFVTGNLFIVAGLFWGLFFPINKSIWTSSYVLYTSGIALNGLALSYWLLDIKGYRKYTSPVLAFGSNALTAYVASEFLAKIIYTIQISFRGTKISVKEALFESLSLPGLDLRFLSLLLAIVWVLLIGWPVMELYKRKIFIKV